MLTMCYYPISALTLKVEEKRKTETDHERKNHFLNFAVDLPFEFYIDTSTLASEKQQVQTAEGSIAVADRHICHWLRVSI